MTEIEKQPETTSQSPEPGGRWERLKAVARRDVGRLGQAGVLHVFAMMFGARGISVLQQIALTRILTKDEVGQMVFAMRIVLLIATAGDLGMGTAVLKYCSEPVDELEKRRIYRTALTYCSLSSLVLSLIYAVLVMTTGAMGGGEGLVYPMLLLAIFLPATAISKAPLLYLHANKEIKFASKLSMIVHAGTFGLIVVGALLWQLWGFFIAISIGTLLGLVLYLSVTRKALRAITASWTLFKRMVRLGFFSLLANFSGIASATVAVMLLKWQTDSNEAVATVGIATFVVQMARLLPQSLLQTAFPYLSGLMSQPERLRQRIGEIVRKQMLVLLIVAVILAATGYWMIPLVFGPQYRSSYLPAMVMLVGMLIWAIAAPHGQLLIICERVHLNFIISFGHLIVNVLLNLLLVPTYGVMGAAIAIAVSQALTAPPRYLAGMKAMRDMQSRAAAGRS